MLLVSPALFGGPASHLTYALAELLKAKLVDSKRFEPPAKVLAQDDKSGRWYPGELLPPEHETPARTPSKAAPTGAGATATAAKGGSASGGGAKKKGGVDAGKNGSMGAVDAEGGAPPPKKEGEATIRVRLKATADMPPRTAMLKQHQVLHDVEAGTSKVYIPGLMLLEAAALGQLEIVMALVEGGGVTLSEVDEEANTALVHATFNCTTERHREVCRRLVERHADPEMINTHATSAWDVALMRRDPALRRIMRPSESDKDFTRPARTSFPIHSALDARDEEAAMTELANPGNVERAKVHGITPLMMAARTGSKRLAQQLLDRGATPDSKSEHGCTAMYVAAEEGHIDIMRILFADSELPPDRLLVPDQSGAGPLMRASENGHTEVVQLLLQYTSVKQCNASNQKGWNALLLAAYNGFAEVVRLLLAHGANPELGKKLGQKVVHTPLCYACQTGRLDCVKLLIASDTSLEAQRAPIALKLAQDNEHERCAEVLKHAGVTADGVDAGAPAAEDAHKRKTKQKASDPSKTKAAKAKQAGGAIADLRSQLDEVKEKEADMLTKLREIKGDIESLKLELKRWKEQDESGGEATQQAKEEKAKKKKEHLDKPPWAFSPSGRWTLGGLWAGAFDRGGVISCEFGEPAHSVSFVRLKDAAPTPSEDKDQDQELEA